MHDDQAITFRKVLPDETLISMTSGQEDAWYAISLVTYQRDLEPFLAMAAFVARSMAAGELIVIDVVTWARSMPAKRSSTSARVSTATPQRPTSPMFAPATSTTTTGQLVDY